MPCVSSAKWVACLVFHQPNELYALYFISQMSCMPCISSAKWVVCLVFHQPNELYALYFISQMSCMPCISSAKWVVCLVFHHPNEVYALYFSTQMSCMPCISSARWLLKENPISNLEKIYIPLLIDLLISNNFSSMTFFCATHILRVIGRWRSSKYTTVNWFFGIIKKKQVE